MEKTTVIHQLYKLNTKYGITVNRCLLDVRDGEMHTKHLFSSANWFLTQWTCKLLDKGIINP